MNLQFPFFVLYIALYIVGLIAYCHNWLLGLPDAKGKLWMGIAILIVVPVSFVLGNLIRKLPYTDRVL